MVQSSRVRGLGDVVGMPRVCCDRCCGCDESGGAVCAARKGCTEFLCGRRCTDMGRMHQVPLFYEVPMGSMGAYRAAVEAEHRRSEEVWSGCLRCSVF